MKLFWILCLRTIYTLYEYIKIHSKFRYDKYEELRVLHQPKTINTKMPWRFVSVSDTCFSIVVKLFIHISTTLFLFTLDTPNMCVSQAAVNGLSITLDSYIGGYVSTLNTNLSFEWLWMFIDYYSLHIEGRWISISIPSDDSRMSYVIWTAALPSDGIKHAVDGSVDGVWTTANGNEMLISLPSATRE